MQPGNASTDRIGPYRVIQHLYVSGSVQVHLAREDGPSGVPRDVVLKMVPKVSGEGAQDIEELTREATECTKLTHPGIVRIRRVFQHDDALVLVGEHVNGIPLAAILATKTADGRRPLSDDAICHIGVSVCEALAHAHAVDDQAAARAPIIHRAVNPSQVLIARDGTVKVDGFGFAKILGGVATGQTGSFKWTPAYMAPEQVTPQPATPKIDLYSACLILWELFAGRPPTVFPDNPYAIDETLRAVATRKPPSLATVRPDLPRDLILAVDAALMSAPEKRTVGCGDIAKQLRAVGRVDAGKRELRELVIRAQSAGTNKAPVAQATSGAAPSPPTATAALAAGLPVLPPRQPLPPPDDAPPPVKTTPDLSAEAGPPRLPPVMAPVPRVPQVSDAPESMPPVNEASRDSGNVWMSFLRLGARTPGRRYPLLVAYVVLTLGLAGLVAKLAFSRKPAASVDAALQTPKAALPEPAAPTPPESEPAAESSESPVPSAEPPPADEFSEELKERKLGYLTVHSAAPNANVYVNLKSRGKIEEKLTVPCGDRFVSIGVPVPPSGEPMWLAPGKMMNIPCGGPLEVTMDPRALKPR
jgi:serine/threonine protein kinase